MADAQEEVVVGQPPMGGTTKVDDSEVVDVAKRRKFSTAYKRRILEEIDRAGPGEIGLILRREGLYSSQLTKWRQRRRDMSGKKHKEQCQHQSKSEYERLEKENAKLKLRLQKAEAMLELQKKAASIISLMSEKPEDESSSSS